MAQPSALIWLAARGSTALARAQHGNQPAPVATDYDLSIVNSVWGEQTYTWETPFLATLAQSYGTGVYQEDFVHAFEPARLAINSWVSAETKDKINDLLPMGSLDDSTRMVLVNALHLKFPWANPFQTQSTASGTFTRGDGSAVTANFMNETETFPYLDDGNAQIVALPLATGELSLIIALPHVGVDLATYEASLSATSAALSAPSASALVALALPKATFTTASFSLSKSLNAMGMKSAFDPHSANFSGLCAHPPDGDTMHIGDVLQKAMISMQETGIEAAAATAASLVAGSAAVEQPQPTPVPMVIDRPYLLALLDVPTGAILLLGHVADPTDSGSP